MYGKYENPLLQENLLSKKNWFPMCFPLFQEIPLLRDTLLPEAFVLT